MSEQKTYDDQQLLALLREDGQAALRHIYERYWKRLYLASFAILRDDAACQDIVKDILLHKKNRNIPASANIFTMPL